MHHNHHTGLQWLSRQSSSMQEFHKILEYLKFIHIQAKPPVLKQMSGADADTIFVSDEQTPKGESQSTLS